MIGIRVVHAVLHLVGPSIRALVALSVTSGRLVQGAFYSLHPLRASI